MKKALYLIASLSLLLAASCQKGAKSTDFETEELGPAVVFTAEGDGISNTVVETKAAEVTGATLSAFNVMAVTGTAGTSEVVAWSAPFSDPNFTDPVKKGQYSATAGDQYWPSEGDPGWKVYASNESMTPAATGPTIAANATTDIVCAFLPATTPRTSNALTFEHIFARINNVTVTAQTGYTITNIVITVTPNIAGTYNMFAGAGQTDGTGWSALTPGAATTISRADQLPGVEANDLWLVPGTYTVTASWTATKGASVQNYTGKTQNVVITGGKQNNLTTTLGGSASEVVFSVTVTPWSALDVPVTFPTD